jgi:hypothetical protein
MEVSCKLHALGTHLYEKKSLPCVINENEAVCGGKDRIFAIKVKSKAIPVTCRGGLKGCEMSRIPHCLDNRLIDGDKVVSPTHRPHLTPQTHFFFNVSGTHFC